MRLIIYILSLVLLTSNVSGQMLVNPYIAKRGTSAPPAPSYDADAQAIMTAITSAGGSLTTPQQDAINTFVVDMKSNGLWVKHYYIAGFVGGTAASHAVVWKGSGSYTATQNGTITNNANGVTGNGSTGYIATGFNPSVAMSYTSCGISIYSGTSSMASCRLVGCSSGGSFGDEFSFRDAGASTSFYGGGSSTPISTNEAQDGFFTGSRTSSTDIAIYKNGSSVASSTTLTSTYLANETIYLLARNASGVASNFSVVNLRYVAFHEGLTSGEAATYYTLVQALQTAFSRQL